MPFRAQYPQRDAPDDLWRPCEHPRCGGRAAATGCSDEKHSNGDVLRAQEDGRAHPLGFETFSMIRSRTPRRLAEWSRPGRERTTRPRGRAPLAATHLPRCLVANARAWVAL